MFFVLPSAVSTAIKQLNDAGYEAYLVGGSVRDLLRGITPEDYDITTIATPDEMQQVFANERVIETGLKHGTLTVIKEDMPLEITTYRVDSEYTDHRHPDKVCFTRNIEEDLLRRDFTINAMAYHPKLGLVDPFGGQKDLADLMIRAVGDADRRFNEDALRILRGLRFASSLGFSIDEDTAAAIKRQKQLLEHVSAERIAVELKKLLCGDKVREILCKYADVLAVVLPEITPMIGFDQKHPYHCYDLLEHTAAAVEAIPPEFALRLGALLHDIGKPNCFTVDDSGIGHCYGHAKKSAEMAEEICNRLKLDTATFERVVRLVKMHDRQVEPNERAIRRAFYQLSVEGFFDMLSLKKADVSAQALAVKDRSAEVDRLKLLAEQVLESKPCLSVKELAIGGKELMEYGVAPGKEMGRLLQQLLEAVIDGKIPNQSQALLSYLTKLLQ